MTHFWRFSRVVLIVGAVTVFLLGASLLGFLGIHFSLQPEFAWKFVPGLILAVLVSGFGLKGAEKHSILYRGSFSLIRAIGELVLLAALVSLVTLGIHALFPLLAEIESNNTSVVPLIALCIVVASRSWRLSSQQARLATAAQEAAEVAAANVLERDRKLDEAQSLLRKAQIEPHFLWNTLAQWKYLAKKDNLAAVAMAENLIIYLQAAVPEIRGEASTLASEVTSVKAYLGLMRVRMGPRLTTNVTVDPTIEFIPLAPLLIHTLVENAIKHGIEPKVGSVVLSVSAGRDPLNSSRVCIEVTDNGVGLMIDSPSAGTGHGLNNIRERLRLTYGDEANLQTGNRPGGGFLARITIPMPKEEMS